MSATLIDLRNKPDLLWLSRLVADIRGIAPRSRFLLAGARARDLVLTYGYQIPTDRATEDVDLAFAVDDWGEFLALRRDLLASGRFGERGRSLHCIQHLGVGKARIDLIPFAGIEDADRRIAWPPDGGVVMNVIGFREAYGAAVRIDLPESQWIDVAPLHALMLLKLAAWSDRRLVAHHKDAQDIRIFLKHYLDAGNQERLATEAAHLLEGHDFDYEQAGAWLLGHDAAKLLGPRGDPTAEFFMSIVQREALARTESTLLADMRSPSPAEDMRLVDAFRSGLEAGLDAAVSKT